MLAYLAACRSISPQIAGAEMTLPRVGVWGLHENQSDPARPYSDETLRSLWVLSYLNTRGLVVRQIAQNDDPAAFNVLYCGEALSPSQLDAAVEGRVALMQSASARVLGHTGVSRTYRITDRIALHESSLRGVPVLTVEPGIAAFFAKRDQLPLFVHAIHQLLDNQMPETQTFGLMPYRGAAMTAVVFVLHGEGMDDARPLPPTDLADGTLTYVVSEGSLEHHALDVAQYRELGHEIGIHNHVRHASSSETIGQQVFLQRTILGNSPRGLVGPFLAYSNDLFAALEEHEFYWYLKKDIPYPLNIPGTDIIDVTESLKPYDDWWVGACSGADCDLLWDLWERQLAWRMTTWETSVFHWHDGTMASCPEVFRRVMERVGADARIWQCTATQLHDFWKQRAGVALRVSSLTRDRVDFEVENAFEGLTFFAKFDEEVRYAAFTGSGDYSGSMTLAVLSTPPREPPHELRIEFSELLGTATLIEFALINDSDAEFIDRVITLDLPERLLRGVRGAARDWDVRITRTGIKGLEFETIYQDVVPSGEIGPVSVSISHVPPRSVSFFRVEFTPVRSRLGKARERIANIVTNHPQVVFLALISALALSLGMNLVAYSRYRRARRTR